MPGKIYLLSQDESLHELTESQYESEDLLQTLLEKYPDLLAGDQINPDDPRRWLLVSREIGIRGGEDEGNRWSLDHLFLDQSGIPTLVEVKRSSDSRIRREVLGQMLDYAANAAAFWKIEEIRAAFVATCENQQLDAESEIETLLATNSEIESTQFWETVKTNLQAGRVRLVFVADSIPKELKRIVEFLNGQMDPAEVLAVEVPQFVGDGIRTVVPRVIGQTAEAQQRKTVGPKPSRMWDRTAFFSHLETTGGGNSAAVALAIFDWAESQREFTEFVYGHGATNGSCCPVVTIRGIRYWPTVLWSKEGWIEFQFQHMHLQPPFDSEAKRRQLLAKLNSIEGVEIPDWRIDKRPNLKLDVFSQHNRLNELIAVLQWYLDEASNRADSNVQ